MNLTEVLTILETVDNLPDMGYNNNVCGIFYLQTILNKNCRSSAATEISMRLHKFMIMGAAVLCAMLLSVGLTGCQTAETTVSDATDDATESESQTIPETEPETEPETTAVPETEEETVDPTRETIDTAYLYNYDNDDPDRLYFSRLTGEPTTKALYYQRPAAIMINNIRKACPQIGISDADVIIECMCEGGITRLMMLKSDYASLDVVGSIRSAREYFVDYAQAFGAVFVHAGGSDQAYRELKQRAIDHIDGVNGVNVADTFFRDQERWDSMGMEHSLMTSGDRIVRDFVYQKFQLFLPNNQIDSFHFVEYGTVDAMAEAEEATDVCVPYGYSYQPEFVYDNESQTYLRYEYGEPHIDGTDQSQLAFTNLLILSCRHTNLGDEKGHIDVVTEGSGDGYYVSMGKYVPIHWEKKTVDAVLELTTEDGAVLQMNCGKTFVEIVSDTVFRTIEMDITD